MVEHSPKILASEEKATTTCPGHADFRPLTSNVPRQSHIQVRPEVTLHDWQDVKIQELTNSLIQETKKEKADLGESQKHCRDAPRGDVLSALSRSASCENHEHLVDTYSAVTTDLLDTYALLVTRLVSITARGLHSTTSHWKLLSRNIDRVRENGDQAVRR